MTTRVVIFSFIIFTIVNVIISYFAPRFVPYAGNFPYKENLQLSPLPSYVNSWANFDGMLYIRIARQNYSQYEQAFFPVYPLLLRFVTVNSHTLDFLFVGLIISNIYFLLSLLVFRNYLQELYFPKAKIFLILSFLFIFPTSFYFQGVYTEGLFFFLVMSTFYFIYKRQFLLAAIAAYLGAMTRVVGIFLIIPFIVELIDRFFVMKKDQKFLDILKQNYQVVLASIAPFLGFYTYSYYLWKSTGNPLFFFHSQPFFKAGRSTEIILLPQVFYRYFKIFFTANMDFVYFIATVEFIFFLFALFILIRHLFQIIKHKNKKFYPLLSLNLFSLCSLVLPSLTGTLLSIPRFLIVMPALFIALAEIKSIPIRISLMIIFVILHIVLLSFFVQGYFIS